jgi:hypothetical protein
MLLQEYSESGRIQNCINAKACECDADWTICACMVKSARVGYSDIYIRCRQCPRWCFCNSMLKVFGVRIGLTRKLVSVQIGRSVCIVKSTLVGHSDAV